MGKAVVGVAEMVAWTVQVGWLGNEWCCWRKGRWERLSTVCATSKRTCGLCVIYVCVCIGVRVCVCVCIRVRICAGACSMGVPHIPDAVYLPLMRFIEASKCVHGGSARAGPRPSRAGRRTRRRAGPLFAPPLIATSRTTNPRSRTPVAAKAGPRGAGRDRGRDQPRTAGT